MSKNDTTHSIIIELEKSLIDLSMPHANPNFEWLDNNPKRKIHAVDFLLKALSKNIALLIYVSEETENHQTFLVYLSSIWEKRQEQ